MEKIVEVYDVTSSKIKNMQLNFYVNREDITALMGNHNCGKTYILELLLGYSPYETGTIKIFGNKNIIVEGPRIAYIPEHFKGVSEFSILQNFFYFSKIYKKNGIEEIYRLCEEFQLDISNKRKVGKIPVETIKRLVLALSVYGGVDLIIWDMPFDNLDGGEIECIKHYIKKLNKEKKITFLLTGTDVGNYLDFADSYIVVKDGRVQKQIAASNLDKVNQKKCEIHTSDSDLAAAILYKENVKFDVIEKNIIVIYEMQCISDIVALLVQKGIKIEEVLNRGENKYSYLMKIMKGEAE